MLGIFSNKQTDKDKDENPRFITSAESIYGLLKYICEKQITLTLNWGEPPKEEATYLLKVGTERFIFDHIDEEETHKSFLMAKNIKARTKVDGVDVTFPINLINNALEANKKFYIAELPDKIYNPQRRHHFRSPIPENYKIPFTSKFGIDETLLTGELIDLSLSGLSIMLDSRVFARKGERIKSCTISPQNGQSITFDLEVRSTRTCERDDRMMRIGASFVSPSRKTRKQLGKIVHALEEMNLKQEK